jgi:hypothetical protein
MTEFSNYMYLLAVTHIRKYQGSPLDWIPFEGGDSLGKIVEDHNAKCMGCYQELKLLPEFIEKFGEGISVEMRDLSEIMTLRSADFAKIRILLVDLEALSKQEGDLKHIRTLVSLSLGKQPQWYYLTQVNASAGTKSCTGEFLGLPVMPSNPEVLQTQDELEEFLMQMCKAYRQCVAISYRMAQEHSRQSGAGEGGLEERIYKATVRRVANDLRDAVIVRGLSDEEGTNLARRALTQEFALAQIAAYVKRETGAPVVIDALREPLLNMPIEPSEITVPMRPVALVKLELVRDMRRLPSEKRKLLMDLGVRRKGSQAIHLDRAGIWNAVDSLKGDVLATRFSGKLPDLYRR